MLATASTYNVTSQGITTFDTFEYNSVVQLEDKILAGGDNGLFILDQTEMDDNKKFVSLIKTKKLDIYSKFISRIRYLIIIGFGKFLVKVSDKMNTYSFVGDRINTKIDEVFVRVGYGFFDRFLQIEIETFNDFKIKIIDIFGEYRRKIR